MFREIIKSELATNRVLDFIPPRIDLGAPVEALDFIKIQNNQKNDFAMNDSVKVQTGIDKIEERNIENKIEKKVLEKLHEVQENAYQEAYQLGLEEGREEAFNKNTQEINEKLDALEVLFASIQNLKMELISNHETYFMKLLFHMASRLAHKELKENPEVLLEILRDVSSRLQSEQEVVVRVAPAQFEFIENLKNETKRELQFLKNMKFDPSEDVNPGGCIIETNYGQIDARVEERVDKLWQSIYEAIPKSSDKVAS